MKRKFRQQCDTSGWINCDVDNYRTISGAALRIILGTVLGTVLETVPEVSQAKKIEILGNSSTS